MKIPRLAVRIVKGILRDETHLDAQAETVFVTTAAHVVSGGVALTADVSNDKLLAQVSLEHLEADFALSIPRIRLAADSAALDLLSPFGDLHGVLDVPEAELPRAARLAEALPQERPPSDRARRAAGLAPCRGMALREALARKGHRACEGHGGGGQEAPRAGRRDHRRLHRLHSLLETRRATDVRIDVTVPDARVAPSTLPPASPSSAWEGSERMPRLRMPTWTAHSARCVRPLRCPPGSCSTVTPLEWRVPSMWGREFVSRVATGAIRGIRVEIRRRWRSRRSGTLDARAPGVGLESDGRRINFDLTAHLRAHRRDGGNGALSLDDARVVGTHIVLSDGRSPSALSIARLSIAAASPAFVIADPLAQLELVGTIGDGRMNTPSALGDLLPAGSITLPSKGGATFDGDVAAEITRHVVRGGASLDLHSGIGVASKKIRVAGDDESRRQRCALGPRERRARRRPPARGRTHHRRLRPARDGGADFVRVDRIDARASPWARWDSSRTHRCAGVDYGLRVGRAELRRCAHAGTPFLPAAAILAIEVPGRAVVSADVATSGPAHAAGWTHRAYPALPTSGGSAFTRTHLAGDFALDGRTPHGFDPSTLRSTSRASHLTMRNVRVTGASTDTSAWSGDLVVQAGTLGLAPAPRLEGDITLQARDASPILGVLFRDTLPGFVAELTRMPSFTAVTHLVVEPQSLVVSDLMASGGGLSGSAGHTSPATGTCAPPSSFRRGRGRSGSTSTTRGRTYVSSG